MKIFVKFLFLPLLAACGAANSVEVSGKWTKLRAEMVNHQIARRGVRSPQVLDAMRIVPRHMFVPSELRSSSYEDYPLPIGYKQTISQPYIVAAMTEALELKPDDKVLEIGTGSGYQAAVLSRIITNVYSIEIIPELAAGAKETVDRLGYSNIQIKCGNGYLGWKEFAPYDAIIVTCAPNKIPKPLIDQLADGGRIVIPVGARFGQELVKVTKQQGKLVTERLMSVMFVPMTGKVDNNESTK